MFHVILSTHGGNTAATRDKSSVGREQDSEQRTQSAFYRTNRVSRAVDGSEVHTAVDGHVRRRNPSGTAEHIPSETMDRERRDHRLH